MLSSLFTVTIISLYRYHWKSDLCVWTLKCAECCFTSHTIFVLQYMHTKIDHFCTQTMFYMGNSMTSRSDISLNNWLCQLSIQFTNLLCESWTYDIVAHTFDIRLKLKLFEFTVNYFFEEFICKSSRSDGVFSHKWANRYTNLNFSSFNMHNWN